MLRAENDRFDKPESVRGMYSKALLKEEKCRGFSYFVSGFHSYGLV